MALHVATEAPESVRGLVVLGATPGIEDDAERAQRRAQDHALAQRIRAQGVDWFVGWWLDRPLFAGLPAGVRFEDERGRNSAGGLARSLELAGTGSQAPLWSALSSIEAPVLVMAGEDDERYAAIAERMAAAIGANARLALVPGAGHSAHLEQPAGVAQHRDELAAPGSAEHRDHRAPGQRHGGQRQRRACAVAHGRHHRHHHHRAHQQRHVEPAGAPVAEPHRQRALAGGRVAGDVAQVVDHQQRRRQEPDRHAGRQGQAPPRRRPGTTPAPPASPLRPAGAPSPPAATGPPGCPPGRFPARHRCSRWRNWSPPAGPAPPPRPPPPATPPRRPARRRRPSPPAPAPRLPAAFGAGHRPATVASPGDPPDGQPPGPSRRRAHDSLADARSCQDPPAEALDPDPQQYRGEAEAGDVHDHAVHVRDRVARQPEPHTLRQVDERVDEHAPAQPRQRLQPPPRVVHGAQERHRQHQQLNTSGTCRGCTRVPTVSPSEAPSTAASGRNVSATGQLTSRCTSVAGTTYARGRTTRAASSPWMAPDATFSSATPSTGIGASTRSSISRVKPKSWTMGSATAWMPWKIMVLATTPPTSNVLNAPSAEAPPALPMPCPILGKT